jgi:hypothetical protein
MALLGVKIAKQTVVEECWGVDRRIVSTRRDMKSMGVNVARQIPITDYIWPFNP